MLSEIRKSFPSPANLEHRGTMGTPSSEPIRVLIIHEQAVVCEGLRLLVENQSNHVVGVARNKSEALSLVAQKRPNVILMDLAFEGDEGLKLLQQFNQNAKESRVLVLTTVRHNHEYQKAIKLGAMGLVLNKHGADMLLKAIDRVHRGEIWVDRSMLGVLLHEPENGATSHPEEQKIATLTARELKVISLVGEGLKNKQIGKRLFICETTVSHRLSSIFAKLGVSDRLELVIYAFRHGLAKVPASTNDNRA